MSGGGSRDYRVIARAVLAELADSLRMHKTNPRYIWNVGIEERALAVPLLELGQNVFGITLEEQVRGDPKTLEASVNANYKIDLKLTEPVPPFDERAYEESLRDFYEKEALATLQRITQLPDPFSYKDRSFPKLFQLQPGIISRIVKDQIEEGMRKIRHVVEARFSIQKPITEDVLIQGLHIYGMRPFLAHHSTYIKAKGASKSPAFPPLSRKPF